MLGFHGVFISNFRCPPKKEVMELNRTQSLEDLGHP